MAGAGRTPPEVDVEDCDGLPIPAAGSWDMRGMGLDSGYSPGLQELQSIGEGRRPHVGVDGTSG